MPRFPDWGREISDRRVLEAMERVPRHEFVPDEFLDEAYDDHPLPIGHGQTISQPYIVALMTQSLRLQATDRVLEIGTGSGYQTAILSQLCAQVYSVEIIEALAQQARVRLSRLGYRNVQVRVADGYMGWAELAPFDAIIATAAPDHVPAALVEQLTVGGRLILPVGPAGEHQNLLLIERSTRGYSQRKITGVVFVPLTGKHVGRPWHGSGLRAGER